MILRMKRMFLFSILAAASLSCGNNIGGVQTYNCCINHEFYVCSDQDSFTRCFNDSNPKDCTRDTTKDVGCPLKSP